MENLLGWSLPIIGGSVGGWASGLTYLALTEAWERRGPKGPAGHTPTLLRPDEMPIREHKMTAVGAGRIAAELDRRPCSYR